MKQADLIFANSETSSDLLYACGFSAPDAFIYFALPSGGEKGIIVSPLEQNRAEKERHEDIVVYGYDDFPGVETTRSEALIKALAQRHDISRFRVPGNFPLLLAEKLRADGLMLEPESGNFFPQRECKSADEIADIIAAQRIAEAGMRRAIAVLRAATIDKADQSLSWEGESLTSERLRAEINVEVVRHGAIPVATIVACGAQAAEPHNKGSGRLFASQPIVIDIFPRASTGYWGDLTRTFVKGAASQVVKNAFSAVREARDYAKSRLRVGEIPAEIHREANRVLEKHGFFTGKQDGKNFGFFHGLGHGIGLDIHEAPRLSPVNSRPLRGGEVTSVEPGLYYPEWGGMRLEDLVVVRENGCDTLTAIETFLEIESHS